MMNYKMMMALMMMTMTMTMVVAKMMMMMFATIRFKQPPVGGTLAPPPHILTTIMN